jgi:hydroxypyruvate isomerase
MKFCANVSMLFKEVAFLERFERAARAGFRAVEFWWPGGESLDEVASAIEDAGVEVALMNFDAGDMPSGDRGLAGVPERSAEFRANVPVALELAQRIGAPRLNALVGLEQSPSTRAAQLAHGAENVAWAADQAAAIGADVTIEPVNRYDNGPVLLSTTREAIAFMDAVDRPNVKLQYDVFHMQRAEGNLVATLRELAPRIGHMQVADAPGRGEPGTGEINYPYVLDAIEATGYDGWIGLEYNPTTPTTEESLGWIAAGSNA